MDLNQLMTDGGPAALVAGLFIYVLGTILNKLDEITKSHRTEVKEMRQEHIAQVTSITDKFNEQVTTVTDQFTSSISTLNDSMRNLASEVHEIKLKVNITNVST